MMYQLPAILLREQGINAVSVVISPLISLMSDQVASLRAMGVEAGMVCSTTPAAEEARALAGDFSVLYLSPEKLFVWMDNLMQLAQRLEDLEDVSVFADCFAASPQ